MLSTSLRPALLRLARHGGSLRVAVIGSAATAAALDAELRRSGPAGCVIVGYTTEGGGSASGVTSQPAALGRLSDLDRIVVEHRIDLLVMCREAPRLAIFEQAMALCAHLPMRLCELSEFYEAMFGHVPTNEINAAWFQYLLHPGYRPRARAKRVIDLVAAYLLLVPLVLVIGVLALLVRRDAGPAFFRQVRIGERGRPFVLLKLRTMKVADGAAAQWAAADDPRVTRLGRVLRRSHLDELPQLLNVLRGEMSLVGPRPEQPEFVQRLERALPFYERRHLIRPGITGWAQVRCGYAGSDAATAWKLCHDLYYMKYRSLRFDLAIVARTVRLLVFDVKHPLERKAAGFVAACAATVGDLEESRRPPPTVADAAPAAGVEALEPVATALNRTMSSGA